MSAEDQTQNQGFSADELELLSLLLAEEGIGPQPSLTIPPRGPAAESPLSFAQQRLWFLYQLEPESTVYNLPTALRIKGRLDVGALRQTLQEIVRRHEALRTTFRMRKGGPVQVVAPALEAELPVVELGRLPEAEREAEAARLAAEEARRPFDLERGPLLRAKLLRLDEESHVALFTMHHIVADGWSVGVLVREVGALYEAFSKGDAPALAELPIQYADYAVWQREYLTGAVLEEQLAYWRGQLAGLPTLELPTDRPRPAVQGFRGATQSVALPKPLGDALLELGRREGATPFMTLLAAFKVLLYRYTRQQEIVVGTPVAGRNRLETEGLIGFFVNTLVLRTKLSGATTFRELLARVREVTAGAQAHQDVPFEKLVEEFQPERDPGRHPLFQVVFVYQNAPQQALELPGLSLSSQGGEDETAKFDLTLIVNETPQGLAAALQYNTDLFEPATAAQMLAHFRTLLEGIAADPNRAVASLPLVGERERRELLAGSRGPRADFPGEACLPQLFEAQAARTPDAVAVTFEGQQLSYGELNERANRLAHHLRALGVGPEALVGIMMERSHEVVLAILATLKAGAAYLPLDPSYPAERLRFMLEDSGARVLLTQERLLDSAPDFGGPLLCLDRDADAFGGLPATDPAPSAVAANAAYVIYTSGSTGRPKGVVVTHANVARLFAAAESRFSFGARDVWTLFHSYAFDFSVWELWGALLYGGRLVVVPFVVSRAPEAFRELLLRERVTVLNQTPTAFRQLMRADEEAGGGGGLSLRYVVFGGEALELGSLRPWYERHPESEPLLVNMYGITETTVHVTHRALREADAAPGAGSLIGEPLDDLDLYVLDERMEPAPLGVAGELYVGGAGLARGYLNRPSLTAERFVPDPYGARAGGRLYRTGDVARRRRDGELEYVGRSDEQVKIRGHRIEVGEVEAALAAHGAVREAAVVVSGEGGEKRLVAYATTREEVGAGELRRHLKERLPGYMMPAAVVVVERMPLTENGKLDRARLASAAAEARPEGGDYEGPRTEAEALLAAVWAEVLGVGRVGINDNFFALGGDSIRSVQLLALAKERGLNFSLPQLFQYQTVAELARQIVPGEAGPAAEVVCEPFSLISEEDRRRLPADVEDAYPLATLQAGMFYHMELMPDAPVYHNVDDWHLRAPFDPETFERAAQYVVRRHAVLRTSFDLTSYGEPLQLVHREAVLPIRVEDLRHLPPAEQEEALNAFVERERATRFDPSRAPQLRFAVHRRTDESFHFTLTESHTIFDGWSLTSTLAEIFTRYFALLRGEAPPEEPPPAVSFRDFVRLERLALESEECRRYWERTLGDCAVLRLPGHDGSPARGDGRRIQTVNVAVSPQLSDGLKRAARAAGVPVKSVLLAAHLKALSLISGQADVLAGLASNGRPEVSDGTDVRGLFLNTLPFRLRLRKGTWLDLVRETFAAEREMLPYRRYPLGAMQRRWGNQALVETQFNFVHFHALDRVLQSGDIEVLEGGRRRSEETHFAFCAMFSLSFLSTQVGLDLEYDTRAFSEEQVKVFAGYYAAILEAVAADPLAPHHAQSFHSPAERRKIIGEWNATRAEYPRDRCVQHLFEEQARRTPDRVAVVCGEGRLTYGELDRRANQLAHFLRGLGVGPETPVGICVERSPEMVTGLLGILKAGGAYVPLDPAYPRERLAFMLADTGARLVLTQERLRASLPVPEGGRVVCLDTDWPLVAPHGEEPPEVGVSADNLAYVIYTSGSTGRPKGVSVVHRGVVRLVRQPLAPFYNADEVFLQFAPLSFDASTFEIWGSLLHGARLALMPPGKPALEEIAGALRRHQVTTLWLTAGLFQLMVSEHLRDLASVRYLLAGGDALPAAHVRKFLDAAGDCVLINGYGPTENTTFTTFYPMAAGTRVANSVPIGRPLSNTQAYVLDADMQPVVIGSAGELYVGGDGLARAYLGRPGLTAERFVPDPFSAEPGARLYRTGDLCRYLPDGNIEFLGRRDRQFKIRGFRVELGEVEAALGAHPRLREVVVEAAEEAPGRKRLVAYFVAGEGGAPPSPGELREFAQGRLPEYMVPALFVPLDALPLTPQGKIDRRRLPEPAPARAQPGRPYAAPQTEVERIVAGVWREVLQVDEVGLDDNFFDLGGDSLRMLRVHTKLREALQRDISMVETFTYPTVSAIARHLSETPAPAADARPARERAEAHRQAAARQRQRRKMHRTGADEKGEPA